MFLRTNKIRHEAKQPAALRLLLEAMKSNVFPSWFAQGATL